MKIRRQWDSQQFLAQRLSFRGQKVTKGELIHVPWQNHDWWGNSTGNNIMNWQGSCWYSGAWITENLQLTAQILALQLRRSFHLYTQMWVLEIHQRYKQDISMLWKDNALGKQNKPLRIKWNESVRNTGIPQAFDSPLSPAGCIQAMWKMQSQSVCHSRWDSKQQKKHMKGIGWRNRNIKTQSIGEKIGA